MGVPSLNHLNLEHKSLQISLSDSEDVPVLFLLQRRELLAGPSRRRTPESHLIRGVCQPRIKFWNFGLRYHFIRVKIKNHWQVCTKKYFDFFVCQLLNTISFCHFNFSISSKYGSKNGKHGWIPPVTSIANFNLVCSSSSRCTVTETNSENFTRLPDPLESKYSMALFKSHSFTLSDLPNLALGESSEEPYS
jgi:hypothetical protein